MFTDRAEQKTMEKAEGNLVFQDDFFNLCPFLLSFKWINIYLPVNKNPTPNSTLFFFSVEWKKNHLSNFVLQMNPDIKKTLISYSLSNCQLTMDCLLGTAFINITYSRATPKTS